MLFGWIAFFIHFYVWYILLKLSHHNIMSKERKIWIGVTAVLSAAVIVILYLGISGWLFYSPINRALSDILLGQDIEILLDTNSASVGTLGFNGSSLPGDRVMQNIGFYLNFDGENCYVRSSVYVTSTNGDRKVVGVNLSPDWIESSDGYYYYNGSMTKGQTVAFADAIILPADMNLSSSKLYTIIISTETLYEGLMVSDIWESIPVEVI